MPESPGHEHGTEPHQQSAVSQGGDAATPNHGEQTERVIPRVLVFFDYACPFCYLDWPRFKRLRDEQGVELLLVPFELRPQLATSGVPITEIGGGHSEHVEEHMLHMAQEGGLDLAFPDFMPNTHLALVLGEFARDAGPEAHEKTHEAVFAAYNGHARDIGDLDVLAGIAAENGHDPAAVRAALESGQYDERLHQFQHLALSFGITATPAALVCNELLIGSRPYQVLEESLARCLVTESQVS